MEGTTYKGMPTDPDRGLVRYGLLEMVSTVARAMAGE